MAAALEMPSLGPRSPSSHSDTCPSTGESSGEGDMAGWLKATARRAFDGTVFGRGLQVCPEVGTLCPARPPDSASTAPRPQPCLG